MKYSTSTYLSLIALIVTAIVALVVVARYLDLKREEEEDSEPAETPQARLAHFERAYYAGQMNQAEFLRIKEALEGRKTVVPPPAAPLAPLGDIIAPTPSSD